MKCYLQEWQEDNMQQVCSAECRYMPHLASRSADNLWHCRRQGNDIVSCSIIIGYELLTIQLCDLLPVDVFQAFTVEWQLIYATVEVYFHVKFDFLSGSEAILIQLKWRIVEIFQSVICHLVSVCCCKVRIANVKTNKSTTLYNANSYVVSLAARYCSSCTYCRMILEFCLRFYVQACNQFLNWNFV